MTKKTIIQDSNIILVVEVPDFHLKIRLQFFSLILQSFYVHALFIFHFYLFIYSVKCEIKIHFTFKMAM